MALSHPRQILQVVIYILMRGQIRVSLAFIFFISSLSFNYPLL